jgi:thioredoxin reductase
MSAALVLGRCRRSVLVVDAGRARNYAAVRIHNYLTRDGIAPARFRELAWRDLSRYGVERLHGVVERADCVEGGFRVWVRGHGRVRCRVLLLATGVVDELPEIGNFAGFYGHGVHHCPYCDAWEHRGRAIAAYGKGNAGVGLGMNLLTWSSDVVVLTDGEAPDRRHVRRAQELGLRLYPQRVVRLLSRRRRARASRGDALGLVVLDDGTELRLGAMFFNTGQVQRSGLPVMLGCRMDEHGGVVRDRRQRTGVPGLYLAGDASVDVQFVVVAAGEGAKAGMAMNRELQGRERGEWKT